MSNRICKFGIIAMMLVLILSFCSVAMAEETEIKVVLSGGQEVVLKGNKLYCTCGANHLLTAPGYELVEGKNNYDMPDCVEDVKVYLTGKCDVDGIPQGFVTMKALGHDWFALDRVEPTCTKKGYDSGEYECAYCGETEDRGAETLPKLDHDLVYTYVAGREPSCDKTGVAKVTCAYGCGMKAYYTTVPAQHGFKNGSTYKETLQKFFCDQDGIELHTCNDCGEDFEVWFHADGDHKWSDEVKLVERNCEEDSVIAYVCVREKYDAPEGMNPNTWAGKGTCEALDIQYVIEGSAKGHVPGGYISEEDWAKLDIDDVRRYLEPNCEIPMYYYTYCKDCGELYCYIKDDSHLVEGGHTYKKGNTQKYAADCVNNERVGYICDVCGQIGYTEDAEDAVPALGHYHVLDEAASTVATCQQDGKYVYVCAHGCGDTYTVETGRDWENHVWVEEAVVGGAKACRTTYKYTCAFCEDVWKYDYKYNDSHFDNAVVNDSEDPTCVEEGWIEWKCETCGETWTETIKPIGSHPVDAYEWKEVPATCTENAKWGKICTLCGMEFSEVVEFEGTALGHDFSQKLVALDEDGKEMKKEATCDEDGYAVYVCTGHDVKVEYDDGSIGIVHMDCSDDEPATTEVVLPATGAHVWKTEEKAADCLNNQRVVKYCTECGYIESSVDVAGGEKAHGNHDYKSTVVPAYCTEEGYTEWVCKNCGDTYTTDVTAADANNHRAESLNTLATVREGNCATGTSGIGKFECEDCGKVFYKVTPAEHTFAKADDENVAFADIEIDGVLVEKAVIDLDDYKTTDCVNDFIYYYHCTKCDQYIEQKIAASGEHSWVNVEVSADCLNDFKAGRLCEVCGLLDDNFTTVPGTALNHKGEMIFGEEIDEKVFKAAMEEFGLTEDELLAGLEFGLTNESTCTEHAYVAYECTNVDNNDIIDNFGHVWHDEEEVVCGHQWIEQLPLVDHVIDEDGKVGESDFVKYIPANCMYDEHIAYYCIMCGEIVERVGVDGGDVTLGSGNHEYEIIDEVPATCQEQGYNVYYCEKCDDMYEDDFTEIDPDNHEWTSEKVVKPAVDCVAGGIMAYECEHCNTGIVYKAYYTEHDWSNAEVESKWFDIVWPDCINDGSYWVKCTKCDVTAEFPLDAAGKHYYGPEQFDEETGIWYQLCVVCEDRKDVRDDWCDHSDYTVEYDGNGWCEGEGNAHYVCNNELCGHEWDEAYGNWGHNIIVDEAVEATCTETGLTEGQHCEHCDTQTVAQEVVPMIDHLPVDGEAKEATCTEPGLTAGKVCGVCGEPLEDQEVTPALNHPLTEKVAGKAATCTETGLTDGVICLLCEVMIDEQEVIPALGHKEEIIPGVAATCTDAGLTDGKICTVCEVVTVEQEIIPALGHKEEIIPAVAATCTATGLTEGKKCSVCGVVTVAQTEVAKVAHTEETIPAVEATCEKDGATAGAKCSVCGEITKAPEKVAATGKHVMSVAWDFNADFTAKVKIETCSVCGTVVKTEVPF